VIGCSGGAAQFDLHTLIHQAGDELEHDDWRYRHRR
jgi:hypothetical protein